jgi:hypothetical protein
MQVEVFLHRTHIALRAQYASSRVPSDSAQILCGVLPQPDRAAQPGCGDSHQAYRNLFPLLRGLLQISFTPWRICSHSQPFPSLTPQRFAAKGELETKILSGLLTGVNRAYRFAKLDASETEKQTDSLFKAGLWPPCAYDAGGARGHLQLQHAGTDAALPDYGLAQHCVGSVLPVRCPSSRCIISTFLFRHI